MSFRIATKTVARIFTVGLALYGAGIGTVDKGPSSILPALIDPATAATATPTFVPGPAAIAKTGPNLRLGKCINLSNMLDAPTETAWGRGFRDSDITNMRNKNFTALRLPVRFSAHATMSAPYKIDPAFMARVQHIVSVATANNMAVIIDMHHFNDLIAYPYTQTPRFVAMWRQIAVAFRSAPSNVYFELINEPNGNLNGAWLKQAQLQALAAVRATNPTRTVIIDGPDWASIAGMMTNVLPNDPYVVPTFHYYDPPNFALDRADWLVPAMLNNWGSTYDLLKLQAAAYQVLSYIRSTGRVPFMGEYGADYIRPTWARVKYYRMASAAFASVGVQSCAWGYDNTFNLYSDSMGWLDEAVNMIATPTRLP